MKRTLVLTVLVALVLVASAGTSTPDLETTVQARVAAT